jgi:hypothetical protein
MVVEVDEARAGSGEEEDVHRYPSGARIGSGQAVRDMRHTGHPMLTVCTMEARRTEESEL